MSCIKLKRDLNVACAKPIRKFAQQVVLVNREDVEFERKNIIVLGRTDGCSHNVYFRLKEGERGFRITAPDNGGAVFGAFSKSEKDGIPQYKHSVQIPIVGMSEQIMCLLNELDKADYFAALQFGNDIILYGYEFGLSSSNYDFDPQNNFGGMLLTLTTDDDFLEDTTPLIYRSQSGTEIEDFDNNFEDIILDELGDFNDDFNDDFDVA